MTFVEIIKSQSWLSVKLTLKKLFPDQSEYWDDYEKVFYELQTTPSKESNVTIDISWVHDDYDNTNYVDISGYYTNPVNRTNEYSNSLAIEFVPWQEWLGMPIDENTLKTFNKLEIIAYCLNEMTYAGFEQEDVQAEMDKLKQIADDYEKMTPEEKEKNTYTWDEVKERFKKKGEGSDKDDNDEQN